MSKHAAAAAPDVVQSMLEAGLTYQDDGKRHKKKKSNKKRKARFGDGGNEDAERRARKKQRKLEKTKLREETYDELMENHREEELSNSSNEHRSRKRKHIKEHTESLSDPDTGTTAHPKIPGLDEHRDALLQSIRKGRAQRKVDDEALNMEVSSPQKPKVVDESASSPTKATKKQKRTTEASISDTDAKPAKNAKIQKEKNNAIKYENPDQLESVVASMWRGLFGEMTALDPESFWDNEPLVEKQKRWSRSGSEGHKTRLVTKDSLVTDSGSISHNKSLTAPPRKPRTMVQTGNTEDWEVKPGCFRGRVKIDEKADDDEEIEENLAFSHSYISRRAKGVKLSSLTFQTHIIRPEASHIFDPAAHRILRACSVATGKLHVTLGTQKFAIGANGMWRIKAGERCVARNLESLDAVVHISAVES